MCFNMTSSFFPGLVIVNQELSVTVSMEEAMQRKPFAFRRRFDRVDWRKLGEITHAFNLQDAFHTSD